jgi:hypothetical protein
MATAKSLVPSADEATDSHCAGGTLLDVQVIPKSVEVKIPPLGWFEPNEAPLAATNLLPSADEATAAQN